MSQAQTSATETGVSSSEGIQPGLAARAEAIHNITEIRENLGHAVAGHSFQMDTSGNLLTANDQAHEAEYRKVHGHGSNETATGR